MSQTRRIGEAYCRKKESVLHMAKLPIRPKNPERVCWGCDKYCTADALRCGNGTIRTPHPVELFGEDWMEWEVDAHDSLRVSGIVSDKPAQENAI